MRGWGVGGLCLQYSADESPSMEPTASHLPRLRVNLLVARGPAVLEGRLDVVVQLGHHRRGGHTRGISQPPPA